MSNQSIAQFLRACRINAGYSQEKLGELLHRTKSCISKIETNSKTIDAHTLFMWVERTGAKDALIALVSTMLGG